MNKNPTDRVSLLLRGLFITPKGLYGDESKEPQPRIFFVLFLAFTMLFEERHFFLTTTFHKILNLGELLIVLTD